MAENEFHHFVAFSVKSMLVGEQFISGRHDELVDFLVFFILDGPLFQQREPVTYTVD